MGTAPEPVPPTPNLLRRLGDSLFFEVSDTDPRGHLVDLVEEIQFVLSDCRMASV